MPAKSMPAVLVEVLSSAARNAFDDHFRDRLDGNTPLPLEYSPSSAPSEGMDARHHRRLIS